MRVSVVQHHGMMEVVRAFKPHPSWPRRAAAGRLLAIFVLVALI